jgi:hypothetical protein
MDNDELLKTIGKHTRKFLKEKERGNGAEWILLN